MKKNIMRDCHYSWMR